jgi:hypothetical protein
LGSRVLELTQNAAQQGRIHGPAQALCPCGRGQKMQVHGGSLVKNAYWAAEQRDA